MSAWTPALLTGHPLIDEQHKEIFARVERLREAMERGDPTEVTRLLDFLGRYVVEHFSAEEAVMVSSRFPRHDAHRAQHANFVRDWVAMKQEVAPRGPTPPPLLKSPGTRNPCPRGSPADSAPSAPRCPWR